MKCGNLLRPHQIRVRSVCVVGGEQIVWKPRKKIECIMCISLFF